MGASLIGGDTRTAGIATVKYCTASGTGCTAKTTAEYSGTTFPYIELELPFTLNVPGGQIFTMPTLALDLRATGTVGSSGRIALTENVIVTIVNAGIFGGKTATFDAYPTTGTANIKPPQAPPTPLATIQITP